jgi:hypothetical protein
VRELAAFLGVALPPGLDLVRPRLRRQADQHTERLVELFAARAGDDRPGAAGHKQDGTGSLGVGNIR